MRERNYVHTTTTAKCVNDVSESNAATIEQNVAPSQICHFGVFSISFHRAFIAHRSLRQIHHATIVITMHLGQLNAQNYNGAVLPLWQSRK